MLPVLTTFEWLSYCVVVASDNIHQHIGDFRRSVACDGVRHSLTCATQYAAGRDGGAAYAERKARLEARGFLVSGYEGMSPVQARNLLVLRLSAFGWTGCRVASAAPDTPPTGTPNQRSASSRGSRFFSRSSSRQSRESSRSRDSL